MHERSFSVSSAFRSSLPLFAVLGFTAPLLAQGSASHAFVESPFAPGLSETKSVVAYTLPEAPAPTETSEPFASSSASGGSQIADQKEGSQPSLNSLQRLAQPVVPSPTDMTVAPGQVAPHQTVRDKLVGSVRDAVSPFTISGEIISAGYSHLVDSSPNYGVDSPAFGQRVGASLARGTSQNLFSEGALAAILREDPRYYQLGSKQNFFKRIAYAGTRPVIGRTDSGRTTLNLATIAGYLGAAALTQTYYPSRNQGFDQVLQTWGTGVGGAALGYEVTEFLPDVLQFVHLKRVSHR